MTAAEAIARARQEAYEEGRAHGEDSAWKNRIDERVTALENGKKNERKWFMVILAFLFAGMGVSTPPGRALLLKMASALLGADQ